MALSREEEMFDMLELQATQNYKEAQRIKLSDSKEATRLMLEAEELVADASRGRVLHRERETSYTPTKVDVRDVSKSLYQNADTLAEDSLSNARLQHNRLTEGGMTKNLTVMPKLSKFSDNIVNPDEVGPDEYAVGQVANTGVPLLSGVISSVMEAGGQLAGNVIPDKMETYIVESAKEVAYDTVRAPWFNKAADMYESAKEVYDSWAAKEPKKAALFEDTMATGVMVVDRTGFGSKAKGVGSSIARSGARKIKDKKLDRVEDLLTPVIKEQAGGKQVQLDSNKWDTSSGRQVYKPSETELNDARVVASLPQVKTSNSIGKNRQVVLDATSVVAERLETTLKNVGNPTYSKHSVLSTVLSHVDELKTSNSFLAAQGGLKSVEPMLNQLQDLMGSAGDDALGLLQLRRDFDKWSNQDMGLANLDKPDRTAVEKVVREVRNTLNDELSKLAPEAPVKQLLGKQASLFRAGERLSAKFDARAQGLLGRISEGLYEKVGVKLPATIGALGAVGATGAGVASMVGGMSIAPAIISGGVGALGMAGVYKALSSPKTRKALGQSIVGLTKGIESVVDPVQKSIMRADRAMLLDMLAIGREEEEKK